MEKEAENKAQPSGFVLASNTNIDKRGSVDNSGLDRKEEATGDFVKVSSCRLAETLAILITSTVNQSINQACKQKNKNSS